MRTAAHISAEHLCQEEGGRASTPISTEHLCEEYKHAMPSEGISAAIFASHLYKEAL